MRRRRCGRICGRWRRCGGIFLGCGCRRRRRCRRRRGRGRGRGRRRRLTHRWKRVDWLLGRIAIDYRDPQFPALVHTVVVPARVKTNGDCPVRGRLTVVFDCDNPHGLGRPVTRIEPPGDVLGKAIRGAGLAFVVDVKTSVDVITACRNTRVDAQVREEGLAFTDGGRWCEALQPDFRPVVSR